jgi:outer membrane lipoprotein SlyB
MVRSVIKLTALSLLAAFFLTACATFPREGPSRPALIGAGKSQTQYEADDSYCRQLASERTGVSPGDAMQKAQLTSGVLGTLLGAGLGAGLGGALGGGHGAGVGAAAGGLGGAATGIGAGTAMGAVSATAAQQRYDGEYYACMYARGHQVPGVAPAPQPVPPSPAYLPPPPPPRPATAPAQPAAGPPGSPASAPPAVAPSTAQPIPCKPTGKFVKTTQGLVPECE